MTSNGSCPRPSPGMGATSSSSKASKDLLAQKFNRLSLDASGQRDGDGDGDNVARGRHISRGPAFPEPKFYQVRGPIPPPRPPAIAIPIPEPYNPSSRTMRHVLAVSHPTSRSNHLDNSLAGLKPSPQIPPLNKPLSEQVVKQHKPLLATLSPPTRPTRARSEPISPTQREEDDDDPDRCVSLTKHKGNPRCKNRRPLKGARTPLEEQFKSDFKSHYYCPRHLKQQLEKDGFYSPRSIDIYKKSNHQDDGYIKYAGM
jgi:hypothetical protein